MINLYTLGQSVTISETFLDSDGSAAAFSALTLTILKPDKTTEVLTLEDFSQDSPFTGEYSIAYTVTLAGRYFYRWEGTSPTAASESEFMVADSRFS